MTGTNTGPQGPGRRWWEIRAGREADGGRSSDLVTGGQGRSRPERSLSLGSQPVEQSRHRFRGFLWPVVSVVAVGVLIVGGVYGPELASRVTSDTTSRVEAIPDGGEGDGPSTSSAPLAEFSGTRALPPLGVGGVPGGSGADPDGPAEGSGGDQDSQATGAPTSSASAPAPVPFVELGRPAPDAPGSGQEGQPVSGQGCTPLDTGGYACSVVQDAPVYLAGESSPSASLPADQYRFLCQSEGSEYSAGDRTNPWWAWVLADDSGAGAWIPVVFLQGGEGDEPQPGLPICGDESPSTGTDASTPASADPSSSEVPYSSPSASEPSASSDTNP